MNRRCTVSASSSRSFAISASEVSRSCRWVASSSRRSFSASYSSLASGLTLPSSSRRASRRSARTANSARSSPSAGSSRTCVVEAPLRLLGLGLEAGELDLNVRRALGRLVCLPAHLDLGGAEPAQAPRRGAPSAPRRHPHGREPAPRVAPPEDRRVRARHRGLRRRRRAGRACRGREPTVAVPARGVPRRRRGPDRRPHAPRRPRASATREQRRRLGHELARARPTPPERRRPGCRRAAPRRPPQPAPARPHRRPRGPPRPRGSRGAVARPRARLPVRRRA